MRFFDYIAIGMVVVALVMALSLRSFLFQRIVYFAIGEKQPECYTKKRPRRNCFERGQGGHCFVQNSDVIPLPATDAQITALRVLVRQL